MRILAIGLGGAGCRIVNSLYATDRRSSKVICVQALAIDVNSDALGQLGSLPENAKLFFPPLDPDLHPEVEGEIQTATIDIGEIVSRIQNFESGETDAIFMCCGLGGSMVDVAPHIIASLRSSTAEPIFGLVTLPCLAEGERHSAKAADDIEMLSPLLDGIILFDNETWYGKIKAQQSTLVKKEKGFAEKLGLKKSKPDISPELATYLLLNEAIVRRISLILRAGEFKADGGLDLAEVVLDSGEVLNTMKGMGYITIGYAVERLPQHPLSFLTSWYPTGLFPDAHKIKASRIVDLAKQAIYHEISTPCDMTSAHKALILIAGPSHELSMKGYMTVRKWIDRSIAGLETRSGDYPVMNTKNVAIIIMLSGLENIPRLTELREIQSQYKSSRQDSFPVLTESEADTIATSESEHSGISSGVVEVTSLQQSEKKLKDEMLVLPVISRKNSISDKQDSRKFGQFGEDYPAGGRNIQHTDDIPLRKIFPDPIEAGKKTAYHSISGTHIAKESDLEKSAGAVDKLNTEGSRMSRHRVIAQDHDNQFTQSTPHHSSHVSSVHVTPHNKKSTYGKDSRKTDEKLHTGDDRLRTKEMERLIIERELQRQRTIAISGHKTKAGPGSQTHPVQPSEIVRLKREIPKKTPHENEPVESDSAEVFPVIPGKRRVIIQKKRGPSEIREATVPDTENRGNPDKDDDSSTIIRSEIYSRQSDTEGLKIDIKNTATKSVDHIFKGKDIQKPSGPQVRDSALIQTRLKSKKNSVESKRPDEPESTDQTEEAFKSPDNREKNTLKKDDISWI
jgi:cell division GTPase FtsZ